MEIRIHPHEVQLAVAATFLFDEVPNQWNVMGGAVLRFGCVSRAMLGASAFAPGRPRAAGLAFGLATLLQIFPAVIPAALALWALLRRAPGEPLPEWLAGLLVAFGATVAAGLLQSAALVGLGARPESFAKIALHGQILSLYGIGFKYLVALDHFLVPAPDYARAVAVRSLSARVPRQLLGAALLPFAALSLERRVGAWTFAATALAVALYLVTPVHYYFQMLGLLMLAGSDESHGRAYAVTQTALLAWSAAGYAGLLAIDSRAFVDSAILSAGPPAAGPLRLGPFRLDRTPITGRYRKRSFYFLSPLLADLRGHRRDEPQERDFVREARRDACATACNRLRDSRPIGGGGSRGRTRLRGSFPDLQGKRGGYRRIRVLRSSWSLEFPGRSEDLEASAQEVLAAFPGDVRERSIRRTQGADVRQAKDNPKSHRWFHHLFHGGAGS